MAGPFFAHPAHRPPIRLHNQPVILLVTVCAAGRRELLANPEVHEALLAAWRGAGQWIVGTYMVMPDHIHVFCAPSDHLVCGVRRWAGYWKRLAGGLDTRLRRRLQPDCWDVQMRSQQHYLLKLDYVRQNPVRKGLVARSEEWPYQGTVNPLDWR